MGSSGCLTVNIRIKSRCCHIFIKVVLIKLVVNVGYFNASNYLPTSPLLFFIKLGKLAWKLGMKSKEI
jgi:hypothetical protein